MKNLFKNKKAFSTLEIIMFIVLIVVVLSFLINPNGGIPAYIKKLFGLKSVTSDSYEACYQKPDGYSCKTKEIPDGVCLSGVCIFKNSVATNLDHAKLLFKSTLKQNLDKCKTDAAGCAEASRAVINILSFVDNDDEGNVYIIIQNLGGDPNNVEFRLYKKQSWFSSFFSSPNVASFRYIGAFCFEGADMSRNDKSRGIGKLPKGIVVFNPENIVNEKEWFNFLSIKQKPPNTVCLEYSAKDAKS